MSEDVRVVIEADAKGRLMAGAGGRRCVVTAPHPRAAVWPPVPAGSAAMGGACSHSAPDSCYRCDGRSGDDWQAEKAARAAAKSRVPLSPEQLHALYLANRDALRGEAS